MGLLSEREWAKRLKSERPSHNLGDTSKCSFNYQNSSRRKREQSEWQRYLNSDKHIDYKI